MPLARSARSVMLTAGSADVFSSPALRCVKLDGARSSPTNIGPVGRGLQPRKLLSLALPRSRRPPSETATGRSIELILALGDALFGGGQPAQMLFDVLQRLPDSVERSEHLRLELAHASIALRIATASPRRAEA